MLRSFRKLLESSLSSSTDPNTLESVMLKSQLLDAIRTEIRRHDLSHFQNEKDKIVQPGCPTCRKVFYTTSQFIDHLNDDVLPPLLDRLSSKEHGSQAQEAAERTQTQVGIRCS